MGGVRMINNTNGGRKEDVVTSADANKVVKVHDDGILGNATPNRCVASFLPVHISQRRLCARTVRVHNVTVFWSRIQQETKHKIKEGVRCFFMKQGLS